MAPGMEDVSEVWTSQERFSKFGTSNLATSGRKLLNLHLKFQS